MMFTDSKNWHRLAAAISALLWMTSLFLIAYDTPGAQHWNDSRHVYGVELLIAGWIGVFDAFPGWFANIFWVRAVWQTSFGRAPNAWIVAIGIVLSWTSLRAGHFYFLDEHGVNGDTYPREGAFLWAAAFVPLAISAAAGLAAKYRLARRNVSDAR